MYEITEADREAARTLREILADVSGFWHRIEDDGPLCSALARHRAEAEQRLVAKLTPLASDITPAARLAARKRNTQMRVQEIAPAVST